MKKILLALPFLFLAGCSNEKPLTNAEAAEVEESFTYKKEDTVKKEDIKDIHFLEDGIYASNLKNEEFYLIVNKDKITFKHLALSFTEKEIFNFQKDYAYKVLSENNFSILDEKEKEIFDIKKTNSNLIFHYYLSNSNSKLSLILHKISEKEFKEKNNIILKKQSQFNQDNKYFYYGIEDSLSELSIAIQNFHKRKNFYPTFSKEQYNSNYLNQPSENFFPELNSFGLNKEEYALINKIINEKFPGLYFGVTKNGYIFATMNSPDAKEKIDSSGNIYFEKGWYDLNIQAYYIFPEQKLIGKGKLYFIN